MQKKIFSLLVLLMTAVSGAWAEDTYTITATVGSQPANLSETATLPYESTLAGCYEAATGSAPMAALTVKSVSVSSGDNVTLGELDGWDTTLSVTGVGSATIAVTVNMVSTNVTTNVTIYCEKNASADPTPSVVEVTPTGNKNEWQFTMPAFAVVAKIEYDTQLALNEEAENAATLDEWDGYEADVTLTRTLVKNTWNTFAAPFNISAEKIAEINALLVPTGGSLTIKELESSTLSGSTLTLNFKDAESIEAGKPYLVKLPGDLSLANLPFEGVEVSKEPVPVTTDYADFIPTLGKTTIEGVDAEDVLFVAAGNTLKNPSAIPTDMKGFRAYFQLKNLPAARSFVLNIDGESTGIQEIEDGRLKIENEAGAMYDLQGRRVASSIFNSQSSIQKKGVYIQNGKKTVVK